MGLWICWGILFIVICPDSCYKAIKCFIKVQMLSYFFLSCSKLFFPSVFRVNKTLQIYKIFTQIPLQSVFSAPFTLFVIHSIFILLSRLRVCFSLRFFFYLNNSMYKIVRYFIKIFLFK